MKKTIAFILVVISLLTLALPAYAATPSVVEPRYTNVQIANVSLTISSSGLAKATVTVVGKSNLEETDVVVYLEKKVGTIWTRVDIGTTDDVWEYSSTSTGFTKSYTHQLTSGGQYRAVAEFTFTATTVEEVTKTATATY